jgi:hypothetical protein
MSDSTATTLATAGVRAVAGPTSDLTLQVKKGTETSAAANVQVPATLLTQEPANPGEIPAPDAQQGEAAAAPAAPAQAEPAGVEIELKLLVDADSLADFNDAPVVTANARNKGARKHLKSVYYDTPERTLWRNGLTLRVRQNGARFVQTVKAEFRDDPLRRGEWEASVASMAPDLALAMPFIPEKLRTEIESSRIEPVFTADIRRHQRMLELPSGTVEIAFDHGVIKAGDRSMPVSEIELELKSGSASAIHELALRLCEHGEVRPSIRTKSARGFDLAADTPPSAKRPAKLRLDPTVALDDAFATILRSCLKHLLEAIPAAEDGRDPDGIHQLRVSLRRLRAALDLMRSRTISPPRASGTFSKPRRCRPSPRAVRRLQASKRSAISPRSAARPPTTRCAWCSTTAAAPRSSSASAAGSKRAVGAATSRPKISGSSPSPPPISRIACFRHSTARCSSAASISNRRPPQSGITCGLP